MRGAQHDPNYPAPTFDLGLRTSRPPPAPSHPGLRALAVALLGVIAVVGGLALAVIEVSSGTPRPLRRDAFGRRFTTPRSMAAGALLALGGMGAALGGRAVKRQLGARRALAAWADREGFTLRGRDEAVSSDRGGARVRILYRAASLGEASGILVALPAGWMSDVVSFAETTDGIGRRIDAVVASARRREA